MRDVERTFLFLPFAFFVFSDYSPPPLPLLEGMTVHQSTTFINHTRTGYFLDIGEKTKTTTYLYQPQLSAKSVGLLVGKYELWLAIDSHVSAWFFHTNPSIVRVVR